MSRREALMYKFQAGDTDLTLTPDPGEAYLIKDIQIFDPLSDYISIIVDKVTLAYLRVGGVLGSHLPFLEGKFRHAHDITTGSTAVADVTEFADMEDAEQALISAKVWGELPADTTFYDAMRYHNLFSPDDRTLLGWMIDRELMAGYAVPEGMTFTITGARQATSYQLVKYEVYDAADIRRTAPDGPEASEYIYVNYGATAGTINKSGDTILSVSNCPASMIGFPFGASVPAGYEIDVLGLLASPVAPAANDDTDGTYTQYLKLIRDRKVLFDADRNGLLCYAPYKLALAAGDMIGEGFSVLGNYSDIDRKAPFMFPDPLTVRPGTELGVYWTTVKVASGQTISAALQEIGVIMRIRRG